MDHQDRRAIEDLFGKLAEVGRRSPPRDADAEAFIGEQFSRQPGAPYYMAQTIVVQEQALAAAQARIAELERAGAQRGGGLFGSLFGGDRSAARRPDPWGGTGRGAPPMQAAPATRGGGFLAGAAQTAVGVAGGMMLGNAVASLFGGDEAHAAEPDPGNGGESGGEESGGFFDDMGFGDEW